MELELFAIVPVFFFIALIYSSAGFGGGSSYLAVLAVLPLEFQTIRFIALICNVVVVSGSVWLFYKAHLINFKRIWPLIGMSVPMAYIGGQYKIEEDIFFMILGITLLIASVLMLMRFPIEDKKASSTSLSNSVMGGGIGFVSGLVGIGGGIFLSPALHLSHWDVAKKIAATTSTFILVNSLAGLLGQWPVTLSQGNIYLLLALILSVFIGGQIGSRLTIKILNPKKVKQITGILILLVALKLLFMQ